MNTIAAQMSLPPAALFDAEAMPEIVRTRHYEQRHMPQVELLSFTGHKIGGTGILVDGSGAPIAPANCFPEYLQGMIENKLKSGSPDIWVGALAHRDRTEIPVDCPLILATHPNFVYGHFLTEMLPRILWARTLTWEGQQPAFAVSSRIPPWARAILSEIIGDQRIVWYDSDTEVISAEVTLIPTRMEQAEKFHPIVSVLMDKLIDQLLGDNPESGNITVSNKVYLSRRQLDLRWRWQTISNEEEVENFFADLGFEIAYPEKLSFRDQASLFRRCAFLAGAYGSALHNSLFAGRTTKVLSLNWINGYQSGLCALRQQSLGFILPVGGEFLDHSKRRPGSLQTYEVSTDSIARMLEKMEL